MKGIVFSCHVSDPERYDMVEFDKTQHVISIDERHGLKTGCFEEITYKIGVITN